jgi:glycosyltransferase 2 family protein
MRRLMIACLVGGLVLGGWSIFAVGAPAVAGALHAVGWTGLLAIAAFHLIATVLMGLAWWNLQSAGKRRFYIWGRLLRDAGAEVLPLSQVGGYVLGARAPIMHGVERTAVAASVVVDATLEFCAQIGYVALSVLLLLRLQQAETFAKPVLAWLVATVAAAAALVVIQSGRKGVPRLLAARFTRRWADLTVSGISAVHGQIRQIYHRKPRLVRSFLLHFAAWIVTGTEAWLMLSMMGVRRAPTVVFALEGLLFAARSLAFMVPAAVGVQEGAYLMIGVGLGLPPDAVLGLSLLKRGRDFVLGVPALLSWQYLERRRARQNRERQPPPAPASAMTSTPPN